ncbi:MAG: diphosphate--fructose-6-phosphate 1-phosphotransferase [Clostridia bacterium]|nr:diphosphate--fructose-6-phosphate 1-phosphotransferase [Clostridia bacterium]
MNIAIAQSGGPTSAINASLLGVFKAAVEVSEINCIYGSLNGIEGIIKDNLIDLKDYIKTEEDMAILRQTPATVLGSCRYKLPDYSSDGAVYKIITDNFIKRDIKAFFYIGGNDSMDTVAKLSAYMKKKAIDIKVIGVPKTIDNDLYITDHTPGFGSAAKFVATTLSEIVRDSAVYDLDSVTIVEIMGRNAGWLAASTCLLHIDGNTAPHLIYLPEREFVIENFINDIREKLKEHRSVIVAISEGVQVGKRARQKTDCFGHLELAGVGKQLENLIKDVIGCKVRSVELNVLQRCSAHISSKTDIEEAQAIGAAAVRAMLSGES